jgi:hypothetical protein
MAVVTVVSAAYSANQQRKQGEFQKDVADYNARVAENEAEETRRAGVEAENAHRRKVAQLISKQRAQLGASNIDLSTGSAFQLQEDAKILGEADALRIRQNFGNTASALDTSSVLTESRGEFAESAGRAAATGTLLQGASSALGTGVADKWFTADSAANQMGTTLTGQQASQNVGNIA